ncbi:hypothetical protein FACS1894182_05610 [Bacteroidia bacterium]|nr:hypothetical protein FACS1894182_05610 [Bacteroidia bacterium]
MRYKSTSSDDNIVYRKAVWVYLFLLIFEGALRKWFLPALSTPLLMARLPVVVWLWVIGAQKGWLRNGYASAMMITATVSLIMTLIVGHQNMNTALYGWSIYFFYFPFIFIMGNVLTREDLLKIGRFILYLSIPMTVLIAIQFYSPQSAWVNRGVGGAMEGVGFSGALDYFRPPGTFSFISGYINFQMLVGCYLFYYLLANKSLKQEQQIRPQHLWIMLGCYLISIPYSISRTHFYQTLVIMLFVLAIGILVRRYNKRIINMFVVGAMAITVIFALNIQGDSINAFTARFEGASETEGGVVKGTIGNRFIGAYGRAFNDDLPLFGYGIGLGTNIGTKLVGANSIYDKFNGEEEWSRIAGECGLLLGLIIIIVRCLFPLTIFSKSYKLLKEKQDLLPWLLCVSLLLFIPQGQFGNSTGLGFAVFAGGLVFSAVKTSS